LQIKELASKYKQYVIDMRREFHMHPEPSLQEFRTSQRIKEELDKIGVPYVSIAGTGVLATIEGGRKGKTVALRADMDALEVQECNEIAYRSTRDGVMHACGHDSHVAMLLGTAKILVEMKEEIKGTVKLFFQPAEENVQGAKRMIEEGAMEGVDGIFGIHVWADLPVGKIAVGVGPRMASADIFKIKVTGKGGHGSLPHQGVDAVVAASAIVMDLQSIVSREISPLESAVVSVGSFHSGTRFNVIASEAVLEGTTRCFNKEIRNSFPEILGRIVENTSRSYRAKAELEYIFGTPPMINEESCAAIAEDTVAALIGVEGLVAMEKVTGGEDFAYFLEKAPGAMAFVGVRNEEKGACYPHHHPHFNIDEEGLETGVALYVQFALSFLSSKE
jgi:amidohydrolase